MNLWQDIKQCIKIIINSQVNNSPENILIIHEGIHKIIYVLSKCLNLQY